MVRVAAALKKHWTGYSRTAQADSNLQLFSGQVDLLFAGCRVIPTVFHKYLPEELVDCPCAKLSVCMVRLGCGIGCFHLLKEAHKSLNWHLRSLLTDAPSENGLQYQTLLLLKEKIQLKQLDVCDV